MSTSSQQLQQTLHTSQGDIHLYGFCSPEQIQKFKFSKQFGAHAQYRSLFTKRESLELNANQPDTNVVLAVTPNGEIIAFGVLVYPEEHERWARLGAKVMMEVKAIEVSRSFRGNKIGGKIVQVLMQHPQIESKIAYMVGYSWTWDLDGTGKTAQAYRRLLVDVFAPSGFIEYETNEPNICLKPENIFMGRIGRDVSKELQIAFKWLRFGIDPM